MGLTIFDNSISLYENDTFTFKYESRLNGNLINLNAAYSDYNTSLISIENNVIRALNVGTTSAKIKVTYGDLVAEESFTVSVLETTYYLSCNYENSQVIVGETDLAVTYSLNYGSNFIRNLSLSEMTSNVSNNEIASINGNSIRALKKGYFDLQVSYLVGETSETITSTDQFRSREKYTVRCLGLDDPIYVLDGDKITYTPTNVDDRYEFDCWLKDGVEFNGAVENNLYLGVRWKINEFNFAQDVKGAKSFAPNEGVGGETIPAVSYNDEDVFVNGLKYELSKNSQPDDSITLEDIASIYLPKMDYRKVNKVAYNWKTNGYVTVDQDHWYAGAIAIGGTIEITYDGSNLTQTITQTYDVEEPFNHESLRNKQRTITCNDINVIQGNDNLQSIQYWGYKSIKTASYIYLSNPVITVSEEYLPYFRLGNYTGAVFYTDDPNAHYDSDLKRPTIIPYLSSDGDSKKDYLYYYQDRQYSDALNYKHVRANYTLTLPAIDFTKLDDPVLMPINIEGGFFIGFDEDKVAADCEGELKFEYKSGVGLEITLRSDSKGIKYIYTCSNSNVINGVVGFTFPVCYSSHCFQRGLMLYQPRSMEKCTVHNYVRTDVVDKIGYFGTICSVCGELGEHSDDVMGLSDVDFTINQFGAHGGKWSTNVQPTNKTMTYEVTAGHTENEIFLPKINFSLYQTVKFNVSGNTWDANVGLISGLYVFPYAYVATSYSGELTFVKNGNQIDVSLSCAEGTTQNITITDEDIINGEKAASLFMSADDAYRTITIELVTLS